MAKPRAPKHVIADLRAALNYAQMTENSARFGRDEVTLNAGKDYARAMGTEDEFIKERTRLWRQSWLIPRIEKALAWAEGND